MWTLAKNYSLLPDWVLKVLLVFLQVKLNFGHLSLLLTQRYSKIINRLFAEVGFVAGGCFVPPSSETQMRVSFPGVLQEGNLPTIYESFRSQCV
ncbi:hypothetical protein AVEN_97685-1 [Araneus ventricosus]|uniref:Uncharacterized protein n=1 Tax=Araneus ventricosus TaxID=182803 RepID=A0A4Y2EC20_ARAVE|nr:hypothetical protein AVEN_97685-1 [Araneus ventricosus]